MLNFLPGPVLGAVSFCLYVINTLLWCIPLFFVATMKLAVPNSRWRDMCTSVLNTIAVCWISCNNANLAATKKITWDVCGMDGLQTEGWYLVLSNHQSWVDILVLQKIFHRRIPFLKFFLKKELIWVPVMGMAWWALDFPFMKRYSNQYLDRNPHLRGKDLEITKKACERFKKMPISVMNFVEGTRFTPQKHEKQGSPYTHLLRPKAGGVAFVLFAMGEQLHHILDVTIVYSGGVPSFWEFISTGKNEILVRVEVLPVTRDLIGDYAGDIHFRENFQTWINTLWTGKDRLIETLAGETKRTA